MMPNYSPTILFRPKTIEEAISHLQKWSSSARLVAGNTTIYELAQQGGLDDIQCLIDLSELPLDYIERNSLAVHIGATTTFSELTASPMLTAGEYYAIKETADQITSPQIRNAGTIGGSICSGIPFYDMPTTLLALGAHIKVVSPGGERVVQVDKFFVDYFVTSLSPDDIVTEVEIAHLTDAGTSFVKIGRTSTDFAIVNAAAWVQLDSRKQKILRARVALGAVAGTPIRATDVENTLQGREITKSALVHASSQISNIDPTPSVHASSDYKKKVLPIAMRDVLISAVERAGGKVEKS